MTTIHSKGLKFLAVAVSLIIVCIALSPAAYADSNVSTPYAAATCGQCDKGTIFSGSAYEEGYQTIPCTHNYKYGYDYRIITYYVTYNRCSNCSFYETTSIEQVSATGYYCAGSATPVSISTILGVPEISTASTFVSSSNNDMPSYLSELVQDAESYLEQNISSSTTYAMACPGCNAAPAVQHYVTEETVVYSPCVHGNASAYDAWVTPVTMYVTECSGSCGFREIHSVELGTGYLVCLA